MDALARDYVGRLRVVKVNTDDSPGWSSRLGILGIPAFLFFKGGREVERVVGNVCLETLDSAVERVLGTER
jgi:thioredoxin-like negative regulator of GroEL